MPLSFTETIDQNIFINSLFYLQEYRAQYRISIIMHLHKDSTENNNSTAENMGIETVVKAKKLIADKLAESGIKIERKQGIAILLLMVVMMAGAAISYINSRPQPVTEFSAGNLKKSSVGITGNNGGTRDTGNTGNTKESTGDAKEGSNKKESTAENERLILVHVAGAVAKPGVYQVKDGSRINDAINAAGGGVPMSDVNALNLAEKVMDGEKIYVPKRGETPASGSQAGVSSGVSGNAASNAGVNSSAISAGSAVQSGSSAGLTTQLDGSKIDLNTATPAQLDTLPGVGQVTAQRIIDYRTQHGSFRSVDELKEVDGIGPKKFDQLKPHVVVN
jgi:comEA protein